MNKSSESTLLSLPQELRDLIFTYALEETLSWPKHFVETSRCNSQLPLMVSALLEQERFQYLFSGDPPRPTWHNLLLTCKTTNRDVQSLATAFDTPLTTMDLQVTSTTATATVTSLPAHPNTIQDLHVNIRLSHLWDQDTLTSDPMRDNKILRSLFTVLKRYILYGPHLSRSTPLSNPLRLRNVVIDVNPAFSAEEASYFFGNPTQQLGRVCEVFRIWLERFARSGILWDKVERFRWRNEWTDGDAVELQYAITCDIWDEADFVIFKDLGYKW